MKKLLSALLVMMMLVACMAPALADEGSEPDWTHYDELIAEIKASSSAVSAAGSGEGAGVGSSAIELSTIGVGAGEGEELSLAGAELQAAAETAINSAIKTGSTLFFILFPHSSFISSAFAAGYMLNFPSTLPKHRRSSYWRMGMAGYLGFKLSSSLSPRRFM